jgi:hypothetical protein
MLLNIMFQHHHACSGVFEHYLQGTLCEPASTL